MDSHCESLRRTPTSTSGRGGVSGVGGGLSAKQQSTAPHFLTQRFAGFMNGILTLSAEAGDDEPVANSLGRLRSDFEAFLTKLSAVVTDAKKRERFCLIIILWCWLLSGFVIYSLPRLSFCLFACVVDWPTD